MTCILSLLPLKVLGGAPLRVHNKNQGKGVVERLLPPCPPVGHPSSPLCFHVRNAVVGCGEDCGCGCDCSFGSDCGIPESDSPRGRDPGRLVFLALEEGSATSAVESHRDPDCGNGVWSRLGLWSNRVFCPPRAHGEASVRDLLM